MARVSESQWIEYFGFQRFPFDRPEAGNEEFSRPDFLASCFVEPDCFERTLGQADAPTTALLFAARGIGKTACRVMVDYYCRGGNLPPRSSGLEQPNFVLSIPHIQLNRPLQLARAARGTGELVNVLVEYHAIEILSRAMPPLVELIAMHTAIQESVRRLSTASRQELSWLIFQYRYNLSAVQAGFLSQIGLWFPTEDSPLPIGFPVKRNPGGQQRSLPGLAELYESWLALSPLDHLNRLAVLGREIGIQATYVLVDGVDEFTEAADDPEEAYRVIRPLLTTLRLMDSTPYLALKFFLPDQVEPFIMTDPAFRRDRGFIIERLRWTEDSLVEILRRRLDALKVKTQEDRLVTGFDALCIPELRGQIENDLVRWSQGNPRYLMILCGLIVTAHCSTEVNEQEDPYLLNRRDVEAALTQLTTKIGGWQPFLRADRPSSLLELIAQGEHDRLEFKASLQWNLGKGAIDKGMRAIIGRAIAGMMNRHGGILLIGVADDGAVVGIENDLKAIRKRNEDGFQLEIGRIVETYLGLEFAPYKQVRFESAGDQRVCVIEIRPSPQPVYFRADNTQEFWVRLDNSTRKLDVAAAVVYISAHWKKK
jgi:hypothetical protein